MQYDQFKVCITTAGIGSRLEEISKNYNKSLVQINNKPAISHIIDLFNIKTRFVIAVGYKADQVESYLQIAHPKIKFEFVKIHKFKGRGSGLGLTLKKCQKKLNCPFIYISCDTIIKNCIIMKPTHNWMGYSDNKNKSEYRNIEIKKNRVINILEKGQSHNLSKTYIGFCGINDYKKFWSMINNCKNKEYLIGEVFSLRKLENITAYKYDWYDIGNKEALDLTRISLLKKNMPNILEKENEALWFVDKKVIKYSQDKKFIKNRIKRVNKLYKYVPKITNSNKNMYSYNKVRGTLMSNVNNLSIFDDFLRYSQRFWRLTKISAKEKDIFQKKCLFFYKNKTLKRLKMFFDRYKYIDQKQMINGLEIPKVKDLLSKIDWDYMSNGTPTRFHGDYHLENILYVREKKFVFLDWRQDFEGLIDYGDIYYDLAKLLHGLIVSHEIVKKHLYYINYSSSKVEFDISTKYINNIYKDKFFEWINKNNYQERKVNILTSLIFLNIAPLHHDPYSKFLFSLGKFMLQNNLNGTK